MTHQIQNDQASARPTHIADQSNDILALEVMRHCHVDGHISRWQRIAHRIEQLHWNRCFAWWVQIDAYAFHPEPGLKFRQEGSIGTPDVEDRCDGLCVAASAAPFCPSPKSDL